MPELPPFDGWDVPRYTPIPDQLFDEWLPHLSEAELKVLLYIMRHTFGWKKASDAISLRQMAEGITRRDGTRQDAGAGVALRSIQRALPGLLAKGLIEADKQFTAAGDPATTIYRLRLRSQNDHTPSHPGPAGADKLAPGVRPASLQQETPVQETIHKNGSGTELMTAQIHRDRPDLPPAALTRLVTEWQASGAADWLAWWQARRWTV